MEYIIGIDSGGTNFRVLASDLQGRPLAQYNGMPANHYHFNREELLRRINDNIDHCLEQFGGAREEARYIVCGTTGLDSPEDAILLDECYGSLPGFCCPVKVINDAELAHYTVTGGRGILVISGTGSIAFGRNRIGKEGRAGGWMFSISGDEGSGSWVSRRALRHLGRWMDGGVPATPLSELLVQELGVATRDQLNKLAAQCAAPPWGTPELSVLVNRAAEQKDRYAVEILQEAAGHLLLLVEDLVCALDMETTEPDFVTAVWGSNILHSPQMLETFGQKLAQRFPQAQLCLPQRSATEGAVSMALERLAQREKEVS